MVAKLYTYKAKVLIGGFWRDVSVDAVSSNAARNLLESQYKGCKLTIPQVAR